ncbi:NTP transferase domain-containing protein [Candidatus Woesearchaeota archaeon]|nr:NTP transferase domain-containing protein [Candidatus Woesearchaeota archaeon]
MKVVILCGGKGTRLSEYTEDIPKPLVQVGDKPILHHLMNFYSSYGHKDFILCLGYKGEKIKSYFKDFNDWNIEFVDTGEDSNKAERLLRIKNFVKENDFLLSYGDDLSDVDVNKVVEFHHKKGKTVTLTAVPLISPFGIVDIDDDGNVKTFSEKPKMEHFMNGGFYVMKKDVFDSIKPNFDLERGTFEELAKNQEIVAFKHDGFWKSMNTLKDVIELNEMLNKGDTPWIR